jgi:hypothetical protein
MAEGGRGGNYHGVAGQGSECLWQPRLVSIAHMGSFIWSWLNGVGLLACWWGLKRLEASFMHVRSMQHDGSTVPYCQTSLCLAVSVPLILLLQRTSLKE